MAFIDFIQKLQNKPRYLRVQILWISVVLVMIIIISFWVGSLRNSFPNTAEETKFKEITQELPSLKDAFKASIGVFFEDDSEEVTEESIKQTQENIFQLEKIQPAKLPLSD